MVSLLKVDGSGFEGTIFQVWQPSFSSQTPPSENQVNNALKLSPSASKHKVRKVYSTVYQACVLGHTDSVKTLSPRVGKRNLKQLFETCCRKDITTPLKTLIAGVGKERIEQELLETCLADAMTKYYKPCIVECLINEFDDRIPSKCIQSAFINLIINNAGIEHAMESEKMCVFLLESGYVKTF